MGEIAVAVRIAPVLACAAMLLTGCGARASTEQDGGPEAPSFETPVSSGIEIEQKQWGPLPMSIEPLDGQLWVMLQESERIFKIDPATGQIVGGPVRDGDSARRFMRTQRRRVTSLTPLATYDGIEFDIRRAHVEQYPTRENGPLRTRRVGPKLTATDMTTGKPIAKPLDLSGNVTGAAVGADKLWLTVQERRPPPGGAKSWVLRVNPRTLRTEGQPILVSRDAVNPIWAGDALWIADPGGQVVRRIDPAAEGGNRTIPPSLYEQRLARLEQERKEALKTPATGDAGCVKPAAEAPRAIAPPNPKMTATRSGRTLVVEYDFESLDQAPVCRPRMIQIYATVVEGPVEKRGAVAGADVDVTQPTGKVKLNPVRHEDGGRIPDPGAEIRVTAQVFAASGRRGLVFPVPVR